MGMYDSLSRKGDDMRVLLYCNVNEDGKITDSAVGERVIPQQPFEYEFPIENINPEEVLRNIPRYRVINGELTLV